MPDQTCHHGYHECEICAKGFQDLGEACKLMLAIQAFLSDSEREPVQYVNKDLSWSISKDPSNYHNVKIAFQSPRWFSDSLPHWVGVEERLKRLGEKWVKEDLSQRSSGMLSAFSKSYGCTRRM